MLLSINLGFSQIEVNHKDWECEFISRSVNGTFLLLDYKTKQLHLVSTSHKDSLVTPLETFHFYEMLIGLESGILKDTLHLFEHLNNIHYKQIDHLKNYKILNYHNIIV